MGGPMRIKKVYNHLNILERLRQRIKHGVAPLDKQYEGVRRYPPSPKPYNRGKLPEIRMRTDKLERARMARVRMETGTTPAVPMTFLDRDPIKWFAQRQDEVMTSEGLDEAAAEQYVDDELKQSLVDMAKQCDVLAAEFALWREQQGSTPFLPVEGQASLNLSSPPPRLNVGGVEDWKSWMGKLETSDFNRWTQTQQAEVDGFLITHLLNWDWMAERTMDEAIARAEYHEATSEGPFVLASSIEGLRCAVFWPYVVPKSAGDLPKVFEVDYVKEHGDDDVDPFDSNFEELQERCETKIYVDWDEAEVKQMDAWLQEHAIDNKRVVAMEPKSGGLELDSRRARKVVTLEGVRLDIFPETHENYRPQLASLTPAQITAENNAPLTRPMAPPVTESLTQPLATTQNLTSPLLQRNTVFPGGDEFSSPENVAAEHQRKFGEDSALDGVVSGTQSFQILTFSEPAEVKQVLAKDGVFLKKLGVEEMRAVFEEMAKENEEYAGMGDMILEDMEEGSYAMERKRYFNKALSERALLDRVYAKLPKPTDPKYPAEVEAEAEENSRYP